MIERDPSIVQSGLSRTVKKDGVTVEVSIIRLEHESEWSLEVVNSAGTSIVWDHLFATDEDAYAELSEPAAGRAVSAFSQARGGMAVSRPEPTFSAVQTNCGLVYGRAFAPEWSIAGRRPARTLHSRKSSFSEPKRDAGNQRHCGNSSPRSHSVGGLRTKPLFSRIKKLPPSQP